MSVCVNMVHTTDVDVILLMSLFLSFSFLPSILLSTHSLVNFFFSFSHLSSILSHHVFANFLLFSFFHILAFFFSSLSFLQLFHSILSSPANSFISFVMFTAPLFGLSGGKVYI